jgi:hypothetical protein
MTVVEAIIARLESKVSGGVFLQTIFTGPAADLPDIDSGFLNVVEYAGPDPVKIHGSGTDLIQPSFQINAHAADLFTAYDWAQRAYNAFSKVDDNTDNRVVNLDINGIFFLYATPRQTPFPQLPDQRELNRVSFNLATLCRG